MWICICNAIHILQQCVVFIWTSVIIIAPLIVFASKAECICENNCKSLHKSWAYLWMILRIFASYSSSACEAGCWGTGAESQQLTPWKRQATPKAFCTNTFSIIQQIQPCNYCTNTFSIIQQKHPCNYCTSTLLNGLTHATIIHEIQPCKFYTNMLWIIQQIQLSKFVLNVILIIQQT